MKTIFVAGAKGQVGCELQSLAAQYPAFEFLFTDLPELTASPSAKVGQRFSPVAIAVRKSLASMII